MQTKKLIINADDFGMSKQANLAVLKAFEFGLLTSASVVANGDTFYDAMRNVMPKCEGLGLGVHLNVVEGKAILQSPALCDENGYFRLSFIDLLKKSLDRNFLNEIEKEFRAQIEKTMDLHSVDHLDSHVHIHAIPSIFKLTCKLAREYRIPYVRTQYEQVQPVLTSGKTLSGVFAINMVKVGLLNTLSIINKPVITRYGLKANDLLIGVQYTGLMDAKILKSKLKQVKAKNVTVEVNLHPSYFEPHSISDRGRYIEYLALIDEDVKNLITELEFDLSTCNF